MGNMAQEDRDFVTHLHNTRMTKLEGALSNLIDAIEDCDSLRKSVYLLVEMDIEWRKIMDKTEAAKRILNDVD